MLTLILRSCRDNTHIYSTKTAYIAAAGDESFHGSELFVIYISFPSRELSFELMFLVHFRKEIYALVEL